ISPREFYYDSIPVNLILKPYEAEGKIFSKLYFHKDTIIDTFFIRLGDSIRSNYLIAPAFPKTDTLYLEISTYTQKKLYPLKEILFKGGGKLEMDTSLYVEDTSFTFGYRIINPSSKKTFYKTYFYIKSVDNDTIRIYSKVDTIEANSEKEGALNMSVPAPGIYNISAILKENNSQMELDTSNTILYVNLTSYIKVDTLILKGADEEGNMKFIFPIHIPYANSQFLKAILSHPAGSDTIERYFSKNDTVKYSVYPSWEKGECDIKIEIFNLNNNLLLSKTWRKKFNPEFYLITKDTFYTQVDDSLISIPLKIKEQVKDKAF
ncbi:MAG: hypothetical protein QXI58_08020, partial [Candidatus Micrarchaeia archaeon]